VKVQVPATTGVTVKVVPLAGEIVAIPLHEPFCPAPAVVAAKLLVLIWLAVTVWAFDAPVPLNARLDVDSTTGGGEGLGEGDLLAAML
jgi:hypothetical protein